MKEKIIIAICVVAVGFGLWRVFSSDLLAGGGKALSGRRVLDIETNHRFTIEIGPDFAGWPVKSPKSGKMTGYPAEVCYWNECGRNKGGTWVVRNETMGKEGPTHCSECGHVVVGHNPPPPGTYVDKRGYLQQREGQDKRPQQDEPAARGRGGR